jgi:hypothetical protein
LAGNNCDGYGTTPRPWERVKRKEPNVIGILIAVLFAALVWAICVALGLPSIVGIVAAILVLLAGVPTHGYGLGNRFGGAGRY